jgi:hypothetical protein
MDLAAGQMAYLSLTRMSGFIANYIERNISVDDTSKVCTLCLYNLQSSGDKGDVKKEGNEDLNVVRLPYGHMFHACYLLDWLDSTAPNRTPALLTGSHSADSTFFLQSRSQL